MLDQLRQEFEAMQTQVDSLGVRVSSLEEQPIFGDERFGAIPLRHRRYFDNDGTMQADFHGTPAQIASGRVSWSDQDNAVRLLFLPNLGSIYPQLRFRFDDGNAGRCEWSIWSKHVSPWSNVGNGMSTHKSFQLAINSQFRFTTRHQYESHPVGDNVCACNVRDIMRLAQQPYGRLDTMQPVNPYQHKMRQGVWYFYQWAIDYGPDFRKYTLSLTPEDGPTVKIYDAIDLPNWNQASRPNLVAHINEFWVEFNSSNAADFKGTGVILVKDLQIRY